MIPFILGMICGFMFAVFLLGLLAVMKAGSMRSREEEAWVEDIGRTMQGMHKEDERMPSALREIHRLEEDAVRKEGKHEAGERVD